MLGGAYYIWIMLAFFGGCGSLLLLLGGILWVGHWMHKKETGAKHGFLELPEELREKPVASDAAAKADASDSPRGPSGEK